MIYKQSYIHLCSSLEITTTLKQRQMKTANELIKQAEKQAENNPTFKAYNGTSSHYAALYGAVSYNLATQLEESLTLLNEIKSQLIDGGFSPTSPLIIGINKKIVIKEVTENDLHKQAVEFMEKINLKYGFEVKDLESFLIEFKDELTAEELTEGNNISNAFYKL